jgi:hypothetical protein
MKRALTISLLLFFLAESVGFIIFLLVDWHEVRKEMTQFLNSDEFEKNAITLTLNNEEFAKVKWVERDREFIYQDKLYDIASIKSLTPNLTRIVCAVDQREADLFKKMMLMVDQGQSEPNQQSTFILSVFKFLSGLVFQLITFPLQEHKVSSGSGDAFVIHYQFTFLSTKVQPPNFI